MSPRNEHNCHGVPDASGDVQQPEQSSDANQTSTSSPTRRDARGRFVKGHVGGPGNPHARRVGQIRAALLNAVTAEDLAEVIQGLIRDAKAGDRAARQELLARTLGKPEASADLTAELQRMLTEARIRQQVLDDYEREGVLVRIDSQRFLANRGMNPYGRSRNRR